MLVAASSAATAPAHAEPFIYPPSEPPPPILDPTREIREKVSETRDAVEDMIAADVTGTCRFQGATIEGAAAGTAPDQTGIICRVYDAQGVLRGGCGMFVPGAAAACAAPTEVVLGPPTVCTEAYAVYPWGTIREGYCE